MRRGSQETPWSAGCKDKMCPRGPKCYESSDMVGGSARRLTRKRPTLQETRQTKRRGVETQTCDETQQTIEEIGKVEYALMGEKVPLTAEPEEGQC